MNQSESRLREIVTGLRAAIDHYDVLRLDANADPEKIKEAGDEVSAWAYALDGWLEDARILPEDLRTRGAWVAYAPTRETRIRHNHG
jgi:hypothetical protein